MSIERVAVKLHAAVFNQMKVVRWSATFARVESSMPGGTKIVYLDVIYIIKRKPQLR